MKKDAKKLRLKKNTVMVLTEDAKRSQQDFNYIKTNIRLSCPTLCTPLAPDAGQKA
jgi:hypothetical protein